MNKYQKLISLIQVNKLTIKRVPLPIDPLVGTGGTKYLVYDNDNLITDLSINGYCFTDETIEESIKIIEHYIVLRDMNTFDALRLWVNEYAS